MISKKELIYKRSTKGFVKHKMNEINIKMILIIHTITKKHGGFPDDNLTGKG